jgi:acetyl-CoA carboxylase beta subunit
MSHLSAAEFIFELTDDRSFRPYSSRDGHIDAPSAAEAFNEDLITGYATVAGHRVMLIVGNFAERGGSIGIDASERLIEAVRCATDERLPVIAAPSSGGTRTQEGTPAFVQMVPIASAVLDHKRAGVPYLVYLTHPTTGGVLASWGSMGHLTFAEPAAMIGFLGPRVCEAIVGTPLRPGVQTAENLFSHGLLDGVLDVSALRQTLTGLLAVLTWKGEGQGQVHGRGG